MKVTRRQPQRGARSRNPRARVSHAPIASNPALRKLGFEVQGRVDEYLVRVDIELARWRATAAQRRAVGVSVRNKIMERLAARRAPQQGAGLSAQDADAVLAELGAAAACGRSASAATSG